MVSAIAGIIFFEFSCYFLKVPRWRCRNHIFSRQYTISILILVTTCNFFEK